MRLWIPTLFVLGEDQFIFHSDVKHSGVSLEEHRFESSGLFNFGRQTGGPGEVVSTDAVGDRDFHRIAPEAVGGLCRYLILTL